MEVKPAAPGPGRPHLSLPKFFPFLRFSLTSWLNTQIWNKKLFRGLVLRWQFQIQEISRDHFPTKHFLVHEVKESETLTSIAKHYGVSIYSIAAANRNIVDLDLVLQGQLLNIPCSAPGDAQVFGTVKSMMGSIKIREKCEGSLNISNGLGNQNIFTMVKSPCIVAHAKSTGYFLVLVPVVLLCIRCIMGAFHNKVVGDVKESLSKLKRHPGGSKSKRWKSALSDLRDPDILDSQPRSDSFEDQSPTCFEDMSRDYSKLEDDYQKFLTECGMSERGYWRGGSSQ